MSEQVSFSDYDLAKELQRLFNMSCDKCKQCCTSSDYSADSFEASEKLKETSHLAVVSFNDEIANKEFHKNNIFLKTCMLLHKVLQFNWLKCDKHSKNFQTQLIERIALLLIEKECAKRNRDSVAEAARFSNIKKISQQAKRASPGASRSDSSQVCKKRKYDSSVTIELSDSNMTGDDMYQVLDEIFDNNIE